MSHWINSTSLTAHYSSNCEEKFLQWSLHSSITKRGTQGAWTFQYPKFPPSPRWQNATPHPNSNICCHFPDCHASVLSDRLIQFSYTSLSRGSSQVTTRGWLARSVFPTLKCFTHHLTLLAPIQCLHMHNEDLLLNRKFYHCMRPKQRPHQKVSHTEIWPHDRDRQDKFHSGVSNSWN